MQKNMTWKAVSICAVFLATACDYSEYSECRDWDNCEDYCYGDCDDDWDNDWDGDWDSDWNDDWNDSDSICNEKLECLDDCTSAFEESGEVIEAVWCYGECIFSFDECESDKPEYTDPCEDNYNECMNGCYDEGGCSDSQYACYGTCIEDRDECKNSGDASAGSSGDASAGSSGDTSGDTSGNNGDDTSDNTSDDPSCKATYDSCVDACAWDNWMCHENCYETYYGCMENNPNGDTSSEDVCR